MITLPHRVTRLLLLTSAVLLASPAWSQVGVPGAPMGAGGIATGQRHGGGTTEQRTQEPAALPGAQSRGGAAPLSKQPSEMGPTEALFDAVNRGDVAAARDAVNRGADMNLRNQLGLTALELSVDLGHNDVAFLLLSLRGTESPGKVGKATKAPAVANAKPAPRPSAPVAQVKAAAPRANPSDGGTPNPNAGFLGFSGGR